MKRIISIGLIAATIWAALEVHGGVWLDKTLIKHGLLDWKWFINVVASLTIATLANGIAALSDMTLWRIFNRKSYRGGWWLYAVVDHETIHDQATEQKNQPIVGCFEIEHTVDKIRVTKAHAYYYDSTNSSDHTLEDRGNWKSDIVVISENEIRLVYEMRGKGESFMREQYRGYMHLENHHKLVACLIGDTPHEGSITELDPDADHGGVMYCERLNSRFGGWSPEERKKMLNVNGMKLIQQAIKRRGSVCCLQTK